MAVPTVSTPALIPTFQNPPSLSADGLHGLALASFTGGNLAHLRFIDALRALAESRLHVQLGFRSIVAYADACFHLGRSQTLDHIRVAHALAKLPELAKAFAGGKLTATLLSSLTRVSTPETEPEWLAFIEGKSNGEIEAEVRDAVDKDRKSPDKDRRGIVSAPVRVQLVLSPSEHAVFVAALAKVSQEVSESLRGEKPGPKESLLHLLRRILETAPAGSITEGREELAASPFAVIYYRCSECLRGTLQTEDGRVEVDAATLERIEAGADIAVVEEETAAAAAPVPPSERDRPNPRSLRRALIHREGGRCANPFCRHHTGAKGHGHHVVFRSLGGRTSLENELLVCVRCHALVHDGFLKVEGDATRGFKWTPVALDVTRRVRAELAEIVSQPTVRVIEVARASGESDGEEKSELAPEVARQVEADVLGGLRHLGSTKREAKELLARGLERWRKEHGAAPPTTEGLLRAALWKERPAASPPAAPPSRSS